MIDFEDVNILLLTNQTECMRDLVTIAHFGKFGGCRGVAESNG